MKDPRPIATQVNELTPEQRKTIRRVGICYDIIMCVVVLAYIAVALFFMVQLGTTNGQIENISFYKTVEEDGKKWDTYDPTAYDTYMQLVRQQEQTMSTFVIVAAVGIVAVLAVMGTGLLVIAIKFPYYSDKRFTYIGRLNRNQRKK